MKNKQRIKRDRNVSQQTIQQDGCNCQGRKAGTLLQQPKILLVEEVKENDERLTLVHIFWYSSYLTVSSSGGSQLAMPLNCMSGFFGIETMHWGLIFKFENSEKGDTYWTLYGDRSHDEEEKRFYVRAHRGPPKNINGWEYLAFVCASPNAIIEEAKHLATFSAYNLISRNCQEWADTFFNHIKTKYQLYWYGPKTLGSKYYDRDGKLKPEVVTNKKPHYQAFKKRGDFDELKTGVTVELRPAKGKVRRQTQLTSLEKVLKLFKVLETIDNKRKTHISWVHFATSNDGQSDNNSIRRRGVLIELIAQGHLPACYYVITAISSDNGVTMSGGFSMTCLQEKPRNILPTDGTTHKVEMDEWSLKSLITWYVVHQQWYLHKKRKQLQTSTDCGTTHNTIQQSNENEFIETFFATLETVGRRRVPSTFKRLLTKTLVFGLFCLLFYIISCALKFFFV